jgi:transcriptional regulator with XRE-family HTH domain
MSNKSIVLNIRKVRESKHLKQEYVAEQIGVSSATYSKIENNKTSLSAERLQQIATVLQVPLEVLFTNDITSVATTTDLSSVVTRQKQQLIEQAGTIAALQTERSQSLEREQRLLNYIKILERQPV